MDSKIIRLGSKSTSRASILTNANVKFIQNASEFNENTIMTTNPHEFVRAATLGKYVDLLEKYGVEDIPLIVADSVVCCDGKLLRKAKNKKDARNMLELQSNNKTTIITCMIFKSEDTYLFDVSETTYEFMKFEKNDLDKYIQSGECMGKAGAIMVEGFCKKYIKDVEGYESTAMGLCIEKLLPLLS